LSIENWLLVIEEATRVREATAQKITNKKCSLLNVQLSKILSRSRAMPSLSFLPASFGFIEH
jgi:hypothetical protein